MIRITIAMIALTIASMGGTVAQDKPMSPPMKANGTIDGVEVTIEYNAPSVRNRTIWGDLVPFDKVWRTGANEATRITFSQDVKIEGEALAKGTYALFTIPRDGEWTVIFNKDPNQWGAYKYNADMDALRVDVTPKKSDKSVEQMVFQVKKDMVGLSWERLTIPFTVSKG